MTNRKKRESEKIKNYSIGILLSAVLSPLAFIFAGGLAGMDISSLFNFSGIVVLSGFAIFGLLASITTIAAIESY